MTMCSPALFMSVNGNKMNNVPVSKPNYLPKWRWIAVDNFAAESKSTTNAEVYNNFIVF